MKKHKEYKTMDAEEFLDVACDSIFQGLDNPPHYGFPKLTKDELDEVDFSSSVYGSTIVFHPEEGREVILKLTVVEIKDDETQG